MVTLQNQLNLSRFLHVVTVLQRWWLGINGNLKQYSSSRGTNAAVQAVRGVRVGRRGWTQPHELPV